MLATLVTTYKRRAHLNTACQEVGKLGSQNHGTPPENALETTGTFKGDKKRWKTSEHGDIILAQYRKSGLEVKQFHCDKLASFRFREDRLDSFLFEESEIKKEYEDLWITVKFPITLSHGQAVVERGFSTNKEVLSPNLQEKRLTAVCLVHDVMAAEKMKVVDFVITEDLLSSYSHACNRYKMYFMDSNIASVVNSKSVYHVLCHIIDASDFISGTYMCIIISMCQSNIWQ